MSPPSCLGNTPAQVSPGPQDAWRRTEAKDHRATRQFVRYDAETHRQRLLQTLYDEACAGRGASLNDTMSCGLPTVDRFRQTNGLEGVVGTCSTLTTSSAPRAVERTAGLANMSGSTIADVRTLEIFLDAVAAHASTTHRGCWMSASRTARLMRRWFEKLLLYRDRQSSPVKGLTDALLGLGAASGEYNREREDRRWSGWFPGRHS